MSNYDKLIKQATKPKAGAPKSKYIDPIIASSFSQDGSMQEICRAISGRLGESNSMAVFRTLIVVHTLIRNGGIDNVMTHLAGNANSMKLKNVVAGGNWQGYDAPRMLAPYAAYIEERIKAYKQLQRDPIRSSESARGRSGSSTTGEGSGSGQRLRKLTVEKGLLRETAVAQKVCSRLQDIAFAYFSDNPTDEMTMTAFRMSLKDTLAVYAAINEGVINILEHYFEMSKPDATKALEIYKRFCAHTEKIVAYLSAAKKISYSLNVPIPNLRHAPVSLAGALQEYLDDPNFEKNRLEYKENKRIADSGGKAVTKPKTIEAVKEEASTKKDLTIQEPPAEEKAKSVKPPTSNQALQDFFESIETDQMSMFSQQQQSYMTGMPQLMAQPTGYNPFMIQGGGGQFMMPQQTGFMQPQQTGFFLQQPQQQQMGGFLQPQQTGFLQPQMTGFNPFRQTVMGPQQTGMNFQQQSQQQQQQQQLSSPSFAQPSPSGQGQGMRSVSGTSSPTPVAPSSPLPRSSSAPLNSLLAQKTGSRNPFAPPPGEKAPTPPPSGPKGPSLRELSIGGMGSFQGPSAGGGGNYGLGANAWNGSASNGQSQQQPSGQNHLVPQKTGLIGSIASEFVKGPSSSEPAQTVPQSQPQSPPAAASSTSDFNSSFSALSMQPTQNPGATHQQQDATALRPQATGFGGSMVKPFQPTSSFGASLLSPQPPVLSPSMTGNPFANMSGATPSSSTPTAPSQQAPSYGGSSFGSSLFGANSNTTGSMPQTTGSNPGSSTANSSNIFNNVNGNGASAYSNGVTAQPTGFGSSLFSSGSTNASAPALTAQPTGFGGSMVKPFQPSSAFGTSTFGGAPQAQQQPQQPQQQPMNSAITGTLF